MKKTILKLGIVLTMVVMLFALTGCGKSEENNSETQKSSKGKKKLADVVQVGDYVEYEPKKGEKYLVEARDSGTDSKQEFEVGNDDPDWAGWRVININDDGTVDLLRTDYVRTTNGMLFNLDGVELYTNSVNELNNICKIYGTGKHAKSARSINLDDIYNIIGMESFANVLNVDIDTSKNKEENWEKIYKAQVKEDTDKWKYGEEIKIEKLTEDSEKIYPAVEDSKNGWEKVDSYTIKATYKPSFDISTYNQTTLVNDLLCLRNNDYWIATTYV